MQHGIVGLSTASLPLESTLFGALLEEGGEGAGALEIELRLAEHALDVGRVVVEYDGLTIYDCRL